MQPLRNAAFKFQSRLERAYLHVNTQQTPRESRDPYCLTMTEISLDSHKDVQFLKSNISLATREKLDIHLPPSAVPNIHSDTLRKRVEEMLDEVPPPCPPEQRVDDST
jgi:hypothetical protein